MGETKKEEKIENNIYRITLIKYEKDAVKIHVSDADLETVYKISLNDYIENGFRRNDILDSQQIIYLNKRHLWNFVYEKCIRKLSANDKTEKEIRTLLNEYKDLEEKEKDEIVFSLKETGFLSDEAVIESQLYIDQTKMIGKKKTRYTLKNRGVEDELISSILSKASSNEEVERGVKKALVLFAKTKGKSFKEKIQYVRNRLMTDGFENIDEIIHICNFKRNESEEMDMLRALADKINKKNKLKYSGKKLYFNNYKYLITKGYESDTVAVVLQDMEVKNED